MNENRFPKPDFESGYQYPIHHYLIPNETFWMSVDVIVLIALMCIVLWAMYRKKNRRWIVGVSVVSISYFGFFRNGCICSIGAIQNVALALTDGSYILPLGALLLFVLPLGFALLGGRAFCGGVCPFGALQELVHIKDYRLPRLLTATLGLLPWIYLILAIIYAITRSGFILCRFDPFIGIFRLGGEIGMILLGVVLLVAAMFSGRPFCRFLCPYGVLLSLFARVSVFKPVIVARCINCDLCRHACPVDAIRPPYDNKVKESRRKGVQRILHYGLFLPVMIFVGAVLLRMMSPTLSRAHKVVKLYHQVLTYEQSPTPSPPIEVETFFAQAGTVEALTKEVQLLQTQFRTYATIGGGLMGLVVGLTLISLSLKRSRPTYDIDEASCVQCGRCFKYCPQHVNPNTLKPC